MAVPNERFLAKAILDLQDYQKGLRQRAQRLNDNSLARAVPRSRVKNQYAYFGMVRIALNEIAAVSGLDAYAQAQFNRPPTFLATDEIAAIVTELDTVIAWIDAGTAADNNYFKENRGVNGVMTEGTYGTAALAGLRPLLLNLVSACTPA